MLYYWLRIILSVRGVISCQFVNHNKKTNAKCRLP